MPLQDRELVTQRQDLDILLAVSHRKQAHGREGVRDGEVGEAHEHETRSCPIGKVRAQDRPDLYGRSIRHPQLHDRFHPGAREYQWITFHHDTTPPPGATLPPPGATLLELAEPAQAVTAIARTVTTTMTGTH
ncbi:hypothetical protein [Streptacidiphilus pinicola]|uniref:hypothetical protein n=1 Tax=Streptacidiphilus pinicola TaxID=2219663 RepID=UPI001402DD86